MTDLIAARADLCSILRRVLAKRLVADLWPHYDRACRWAAGLVADPDAVDDVVQEALIAIYRRPSYRGASSPLTYLRGVIAHKARDWGRRQRRRQRLEHRLRSEALAEDMHFERPGPIERDAEYREELERALAQLPPHWRRGLLLRYAGAPLAEIQHALGLDSYKATAPMLSRARKAMRKRHRPMNRPARDPGSRGPLPGNPRLE